MLGWRRLGSGRARAARDKNDDGRVLVDVQLLLKRDGQYAGSRTQEKSDAVAKEDGSDKEAIATTIFR